MHHDQVNFRIVVALTEYQDETILGNLHWLTIPVRQVGIADSVHEDPGFRINVHLVVGHTQAQNEELFVDMAREGVELVGLVSPVQVNSSFV
tara:strand:- start:3350 stop:3625 length:276 start_codon:yes stop_codon:yes gene_type:complete